MKNSTPKVTKRPLVDRLTALIDAEEERIALEKNPVKRQTAIRTVVMLCGELRKAEKTDTDAIKKLSPAVVMTWIKLQTPEYRARHVREVSAIDATERKSVLG